MSNLVVRAAGTPRAREVHRTYQGLIEHGRVTAKIATIEREAQALGITKSRLLAETEQEGVGYARAPVG